MTIFEDKVYAACKQIPRGYVTTYKGLAAKIGHPNSYRAVGTALKKNPYAPIVPCHRVIAADCSLGGFYGSKSPETLKRKIDLLTEEGVKFEKNNGRDDEVKANKVIKVLEDYVKHSF